MRPLAALLAVLVASPLWAAPADLTAIPAPMLGADPPQTRDLATGDASVSTQTGSMTYRYPIQAPPGRMGMAPSLALVYSSQAPTYGGVAAGWTLDVPQIRMDTSESVLAQTWNAGGDPDAWRRERYVSTMSGSRPLVVVDEPVEASVRQAYRAQHDDSYTRYERMVEGAPYLWRAWTTDGTTHYFGDAATWSGSSRVVPLTRSVDRYGNQIQYWWHEGQLVLVRYTSNPAAGMPHFAEVRLDYVEERCGDARLPIGAAEDLRLGVVEGKRKLVRIDAVALDPTLRSAVHTRRYTFGYDTAAASCTAKHGPLRLLASIQESAWGATAAQPRVDLPPVTFDYNRLERTFDRVAFRTLPWAGPQTIDRHALSAGERGPGAQWNAVHSMLLDFDGDGLQDRLTSATDPTAPDECAFAWERNLGADSTGTVRFDAISAPQRMPRLPWRNGGKGPGESCALNYQLTKVVTPGENQGCGEGEVSHLAYRWLDLDGDARVDLVAAIHRDSHFDPARLVDPTTGHAYHPGLFAELGLGSTTAWPGCPGDTPDGGACPALEATCIASAIECAHGVPCAAVESEVLSCVSDAPHVPCGVMQKGFDPRCTWDPSCPTYDPLGQASPGLPPSCGFERAFETCGRYPWLFFRNTGGGLATVGQVTLQPVPLESDGGDSPSGGAGAVVSQSHAVTDLDGDGLVDLVVRGVDFGAPFQESIYWVVFRGAGDGRFIGFDGDDPYVWVVPPNATVTGACGHGAACAPTTVALPDHDIRGHSSLVDLNGDGALDFAWSFVPNAFAQGFFNTGTRFRMYSTSVPAGDALGAPVDYLSRSFAHADAAIDYGPFVHWMKQGWKDAVNRPVDWDEDGRIDVARGTVAGFALDRRPSALQLNQGGWFAPALALDSVLRDVLVQRTIATELPDRFTWASKRDLVDLDGDGLPEHWNFDHSHVQGGPTVHRDESDQPLRLLRRIQNGRGGTVDITYAASTNPEVVTQAPGFRLPQVQWVVRALSTSDAWDSDVAKTSYRYVRPIWNRDERARWGFRGFEEVTAMLPSGARTVESYGFDVDWSGRLAVARTYAAEAPAHPATIEKTTWARFALFGGALTTFHPTVTERWTCANGQPEVACTGLGTPRVKTVTDWQPLASFASGAAPQLIVAAAQTIQSGASYAAGDRRTADASALYADATHYQVLHVAHAAYVSTGANDELTDFQQWAYDPAYRHVERHTQYFAANPTARGTTEWTYDAATGVKRSTRTPEHDPSGPRETYAYDPDHRFVTSTTNELGHVTSAAVEPGTGATLWQRGPLQESCGAACTNHAQTWTDVDGLGRPIASYVNRGPSGAPWTKTLVATTSYTDAIIAGAPTRVRVQGLLQYAPLPPAWSREDTELDGRGRPIRVRAATGGPIDAVTTYDYDHRGHVVAVTLPDPSADSAATVTYTYGYDSLGRATSMRRPAVGGAASGVDMTYDGLVHRSDEVAGGQGGPASRKTLVHDVFGRLVEVREYPIGPAGAPAVTRYTYDARDAVTRIDSADGVTTELFHDFAGRRVRIVRAGKRTWHYTYDRNGNLVAERSPPPSDAQAAAYTSTFAYDAIDRVVSRSAAPRDLDPSGADAALLGLGPITFTYDSCPGGTGRLCSATHPGGVVATAYAYDAEGNPVRQIRSFDVAGVSGSRTTETAFGPGGRVIEQHYPDGPTGAPPTVATFGYDTRGKPATVAWRVAGGSGVHPVAVQTRNVAGLVTSRTAPLSGTAGWRDFASTWTYDRLTRVTEQRIADTTDGVHAQQSVTYFGQDDPATLDHFLDGAGYAFDFEYDPRHQLLAVREALGKYDASYAFTPGGRLTSASVTAMPAPGGEVVDRSVGYEYGGDIDPEAPTALTVDGGAPLRSFTYDLAGNQVTATDGPLTSTPTERFLYDGEDQLRRATRYLPGTTTATGIEEYFYDHEGNRAAVVTRKANGAVTKVRVFIGDVELELDSTGTVTRSFAHLSLGTPVARIDRDAAGTSTLELQYHGLSSNTLVTLSPSGTLTAGFVYGPYGDILESTGTATSSHRRRFNDEFRDDLTRLTYYGVRYYDALSLTWTQSDPLYRFAPDSAWTEPRRANLYHFVLGNPIRYRDPDGRDAGPSGVAESVVRALSAASPEPHIRPVVRPGGLGLPSAGPRSGNAFIGIVALTSLVQPDNQPTIPGVIGESADSLQRVSKIGTELRRTGKTILETGNGVGTVVTRSADVLDDIATSLTSGSTMGPPGSRPPDDCSDVPYATRRSEFDRTVRKEYWKREARDNPGNYSPDAIERMKKGRAPIGSDNHSMELHHRRPLSKGGCNSDDNLQKMTRTGHRGKHNYKTNHPD